MSFDLAEFEAVVAVVPEPEEPGWRAARRVLDAAGDLLEQGEWLLEALPAEAYRNRLPVAFNGSIGGHYRHCLDHFTSLLRGLETGLVDYDHRARDVRIETDPVAALALTRRLRAGLAGLDPGLLAGPVPARCEVSYEHGDSPEMGSTFGRELMYAIAHGIHHYALISVMARLQGVALPARFGVAPSTVVHEAQLARTAA